MSIADNAARDRGNRIFLFLLLVLVAVSAGCKGGDEGEERTAQPVEADTAREARREANALEKLTFARQAGPAEKVEKLADVAHLYADTEAGAVAFYELVAWLVQRRDRDYARALAELESFRRQIDPPGSGLLTAASLYVKSLTTALGNDTVRADERETLEKLRDRALEIWTETADVLGDSPAASADLDVQTSRGEAYFFAGRYREADAAWARVESFSKPAPVDRRVALLVARADLLSDTLGAETEGVELYRAARKLLDQSDDEQARDVYGAHIAERLEALGR